jgi:UrcA family protein
MKRVLQAQAIALLAAAAVCGGAVAQDFADVTVQASRIEKSQTGKSSSGIPLLAVSVTHVVSAADLDLRTSQGMATLQDRVEQAAEHGCSEISMVYRDAKPDNRTCTRQATSETMARVRALLAAN